MFDEISAIRQSIDKIARETREGLESIAHAMHEVSAGLFAIAKSLEPTDLTELHSDPDFDDDDDYDPPIPNMPDLEDK